MKAFSDYCNLYMYFQAKEYCQKGVRKIFVKLTPDRHFMLRPWLEAAKKIGNDEEEKTSRV